jgi:hypothetical protein
MCYLEKWMKRKMSLLKTSLVISLFICTNSMAKVEIIKNTLPTEFKLLFNTLKRIKGYPIEDKSKTLEENLSKVQKKYVYYFIKAEIYKTILDHEYDTYAPNIILSNKLFTRMEKKIDLNANNYTAFSKWIFRSFLSDLKFRLRKNQEISSMSEAKFLKPWFKNMSELTPHEFNQLTMSIASEAFTRISVISEVLKNQTAEGKNLTSTKYFKIDNEPEVIEQTQGEALKSLNEIIPTQEELDAELKKIEAQNKPQDEPQWRPESDKTLQDKKKPEKSDLPEEKWAPKS